MSNHLYYGDNLRVLREMRSFLGEHVMMAYRGLLGYT